MISNKEIKGLDFNTIQEFFNYVIDSKVNGQPQQARDFIQRMSKAQKRDFLNFIEFNLDRDDDLATWLKDEVLNTLTGTERKSILR